MLLMIDNYDSFTFNPVQYFGELGEEVRVFRNDEIDVAGIAALKPDHLVLSPGPCSPAEAACAWRPSGLHRQAAHPGVCPATGHRRGAGRRIVRAKTQMHGKTDVLHHDGRASTPGCRRFTVIRYHSLVIEQATRPEVLEITATPQDDEIMGVRHRELAGTKTPLEGVQFHPESILTEHGHAMLRNFVELRG